MKISNIKYDFTMSYICVIINLSNKGDLIMARATTKTDMLIFAMKNYETLHTIIGEMTELELATSFSFTHDIKKKEAHWGRDKNIRDILIHLYEWHQLLLNWINSNQKGDCRQFLQEPYNWKTYGEMNVGFWKKHQNTSLEKAYVLFEKSHNDVMKLGEQFSNEELFSKDVFPWVGGSTLGSYFVSATASHYDWAMKKLKAHKKNCTK